MHPLVMSRKLAAIALLASLIAPSLAPAQTLYSEDFTGASTTNDWYFYNGACLTAGSSSSLVGPGNIPSCSQVRTSYYNENLVGGTSGAAGSAQTLPDSAGNGALRLTNGYITSSSGGYNQNGAIVAADTFSTGAGVQITFKTVTYRGDSGGGGSDGADGISFFLMDGGTSLSSYSGVGAFGGSLGYTCSNNNNDGTLRPDGTPRGYDGLVGGYIGLGIDEYGNFLNQGDNTASGFGYVPGRIGLRGAGNISWKWLNANYASRYPSSLSTANRAAAVRNTCASGFLWDYSNAAAPFQTATAVLDYPAISGAFSVLPVGTKIAKEYSTGGYARTNATPILYKLKITQDGLLSLSYSINGGAYSSVLTGQSITASNGALPSSFRFGFAGSSGGSTNIHEIMCFKASPAQTSGSSTSVNEKQAAKVDNGTQAYFAYYDPNNWTGRLTANTITDTAGVVSVSATANWDASCVLTGIASGAPCDATGVSTVTAAQGSASRVMTTWNGSAGVAFTSAGLGPTLLASTVGIASRLSYLRGDRSNEINSAGVGLYRARDSVLGDIVDSSPTWVGPPSSPYTGNWADRLYSSATAPEASATQTYVQYVTAQQTRLNVVYTGANDGFLHGNRTGSFDASGNFVNNSTTPNDGREVLAYMPGEVLKSIHSTSDNSIDFSSTQYGHNFYVDAPPATGDLYYGNTWHTWLVGGLGPGGKAIYALDVSDPTQFTEANASTIVKGEWTPSTITCTNYTNCGNSLGNTFGTPQIRRLHNGTWAVIFGNGYQSSTGDAGIFIMTINNAGTKTFYYFSTGTAGSNGISYVAPADLDGDHITDYVYAGDLLGNLWRLDLTNSNAGSWTMGSAPLFAAGSAQPISTKPTIASVPVGGTTAARLIIAFGTGRRTQLTNVSGTTYASGTQDLYGVWDWNLASWNSLSTTQYQSLSAAGTGLASPYKVQKANLQQQAITVAGSGNRDGSSTPICWKSPAVCGSGNDKFGWYIDLPGGNEQIVYNPLLFQGAFIVDSTVPATNGALSCTQSLDTGYTYIVKVDSGSNFTGAFVNNSDTAAAGLQTDATGTPYLVTTVEGTTSLVYQTISGSPNAMQISLPSNLAAQRLTWIELR
jgi:type IV pilus assembly protein PilY1